MLGNLFHGYLLVVRILILALAFLLFSASVGPISGATTGDASHLKSGDAHAQKSARHADDRSSKSVSVGSGERIRDYYDTEDGDFVKRFLKPGSYMRVDEVKPGMEGYGLSVFRGTKIEKFHVRVIGVMKRVNNGKDAILVRLSGAAMGKNNVIRGMSGSPVYIEDKLVGAVSYGFDFSTEPIAGVTPIVDMLDAMAKPRETKIGSHLHTNRSIALAPSTISAPAAELGRFRKMIASATAPRMVPLMAPVSLSGFSGRAQEYLRSRLEPIGLSVSDGAGGALDPNVSSDEVKEANALKPGSAMGVMLTTGDFASASTGTVTANFGGKVVGFGHPFVEAGLVDFPLTSAYILEVLPSLSISFKLSAPIQVLGNLFSDRPWSVGGEIGGKAKMLPVSIEVTDNERGIRKSFSSQVIDHEDLTPELIAACTMSAVDSTYQSSAPYVARVETNVEIDNGSRIKRFDCLTNSPSGSGMSSSLFRPFFADPVSGSIHTITSRVLSNRYKKVHLKSVNLKIKLETGRDLTRIVRVSTDKPVVKPGENVTLSCLLEPYDGEPYTETIDVTIPRSVPDGDIVIGVSGGSQLEDLRKRMNLIDPPSTGLEQIVRRIQDRPRGDRLFAVVALPNQAIHVDGEVVDSPPGHWNKLFFSNRYTHGPSLVNGERRISKELASLVEGTHIVAVSVKRPDPFLELAPWYIAPPSGSGKASMGAYVTSQAQKAIDTLNKNDAKAKVPDPAATTTTDASKTAGISLWSSISDDTHIRPVQVWSQTDDTAYKGGTRDGVIIDSWGRLFPGFKQTTVTPLPSLRAWSSVWSKGSVYIGASNRIYRWNPGLVKPVEVAKFESVAVPAMTADSKGRIYASLVPGGRIVSFDPGSQGSEQIATVATLSESLVTSLAVDDENTVYAGVADTGRVYKLKDGVPKPVADTGDAHVLCLFFDPSSKRLYVGCGEQGNVYSISKEGALKAEYHTGEHLVTGVCRAKNGDLFVTTSGTGKLIRIASSGETFDLATSDAFYTLFYHRATDSVFAGDAEGDITQIQEEPLTGQSFFVPVKHSDQEAVIAFASDEANRLFAVTSNLPSVISFDVKPEGAAFTSPVKDAGRNAHWSLLRVYGSFNELRPDLEKMIAAETRTGNTVRPDDTWSPWSQATLTAEGYQINSKDGRYFQYRLRWTGGNQNAGDRHVFPLGRESVVGRVTATFLPTNIRPRFSSVSLRAGTYLSDTEEISIVGADPDGDSLSLAIDISNDNGTTWQSLKTDLRADRTIKKDSKPAEKKKAETTSGATESKPVNNSSSNETKPSSEDSSPTGDGVETPEGSSSDSDDGESKNDGSEGTNAEPDGPTSGLRKSPDDDSNSLQSNPDFLQSNPDSPPASPNKPDDKNSGEKKDNQNLKKSDEKANDKNSGQKSNPKNAAKTSAVQAPNPKKPAETEQTDKFVWSLNPGSFKNGHHILRFTLSDAPSNMVHPEQIRCYRYVVLDTVKPEISSAKATVSADRHLNIDVSATDATSPIANATFTVEGEQARAFVFENGLADRRQVQLVANGIPLKKGSHKVEIEISDRAGNKVTKTIRIPSH